MDNVFARVLPGSIKPTTPHCVEEKGQTHIEWPGLVQALNRLIRAYLDGEPLEGWALDLLKDKKEQDIETLLDTLSRSLLDSRDAPVLRSELRLARYVVHPLWSRLREDVCAAVKLALVARNGKVRAVTENDSTLRVVAYGGLPLIAAGIVDEAELSSLALRVDDRILPITRIANTEGTDKKGLFQCEIAPLEVDKVGLRTIHFQAAANRLTVLCHSVPTIPGLRLLDRDVFGSGFEVRGDRGGAELGPGTSGRLTMPRITDGLHPGYIDLCFAAFESENQALAPEHRPITVLAHDHEVRAEVIRRADLTLLRLSLSVHAREGDFGIVPITIINHRVDTTLCLVAAHSGLFLLESTDAEGVLNGFYSR